MWYPNLEELPGIKLRNKKTLDKFLAGEVGLALEYLKKEFGGILVSYDHPFDALGDLDSGVWFWTIRIEVPRGSETLANFFYEKKMDLKDTYEYSQVERYLSFFGQLSREAFDLAIKDVDIQKFRDEFFRLQG